MNLQPKTNLLLVEDDPHLRFLLSAVLSNSGYAVRSAQDGFTALGEIRNELPEIILSDLYMEGMSGFELLSVVRRRFPGIPVVAMSSAYSGMQVPEGIVADAFYAKEGNPKALLRIVGDLNRAASSPPDRQNTALVPIWLAQDKGDGLKQSHVSLTCPECLRSFHQPTGRGACVVHTTTCIFCESSIRYAFV